MITEVPRFDAAGFNSLWLGLVQADNDRQAGDQLSRDRLEPKVKAVAMAANTDNLALDGASVVHSTGAASVNLTGFVAPDPGKARVVIFYNSGSGTITLKHNTTSSAANRLFLISGGDTTKATGTGTIFIYLSSLWRQVI